jgi:hypothetical protein
VDRRHGVRSAGDQGLPLRGRQGHATGQPVASRTRCSFVAASPFKRLEREAVCSVRSRRRQVHQLSILKSEQSLGLQAVERVLHRAERQ